MIVIIILSTSVIRPPKADAFVLALVPAIAIVGVAALLVYAGICFTSDDDARKASQDFWAGEINRVGANSQILLDEIGGFAQDVGSNFVRVSESAWDMVRGYGAEQVTADMTEYSPPVVYDEATDTILNGDGSLVSNLTGTSLWAPLTFQFGTDTVVANLTETYGNSRWQAYTSSVTYNGVTISSAPNPSLPFFTLANNAWANTVFKCVMLGTSIKVYYWGDMYGGEVSYAWVELGHATNTISVGAVVEPINATAYPQAITNNYTEIQNITTGERSIPIEQSLAGVNADALAVATTEAMGLTLPDTMTAPLDWEKFKGLSLPQVITTKFPFSIPWDLMRGVGILSAPSEVPVFTIPFVIERFGIDESLTIDMSQFEILAKLCRFFILALFMFMIIFATKSLIGGNG